MSLYVERLVQDGSTLKGSARSVLLAIARYADESGRGAYPSVSTLSKNTGLSVRTVQYGLEKAVEAGELKRLFNYGPNGTNCYEIVIEQLLGAAVCTGARSAYKGSSIRGNHSYSSSRSVYSQKAKTVKPSESVSTPKSRSWKRWAKRGDPDWQCPICLQVGCPGCPGYMTDEQLNASFDAAMRDTLDAGKPGPAQNASVAALRKAYETWEPYKITNKDGTELGRGEIKPRSLEQERIAQEQARAEWDQYERSLRVKLQEPEVSTSFPLAPRPKESTAKAPTGSPQKRGAERIPTPSGGISGNQV